MLKLEVVETLARLNAINADWCGLVETLSDVTPFQLPDWNLTWWRHFGSGSLRVFAFWDNDALAGIVPCFLHEWEGRQQLTLIGTGISDYLEPPLMPGYEKEAVAALESYLSSAGDWHRLEWQDLNGDSPWCDIASGSIASDRSIAAAAEDDVVCSELSLTGTFEELWESRSKDLRRNLRRYTERALAMGPLQFDVVDNPGSALTDALIDLHGARWSRHGEPGMIEANRSSAFIQEIVEHFAPQGLIRYFTLHFRGELAAVILAFRFRNKIYAYLSALDPDYEILGFGRTLLHDAIRHSYEQGIQAWNFLRGDEHYKFSWGADRIRKVRLQIRRTDGAHRDSARAAGH